jgi:HEAT repeat protein
MARVYVSSTYQDLKEYREGVRLVLQRLRQEDVAMETYVAEPERPVDKCLNDVAACDLYIGVFAWRYGYVPPGFTQSITELEYRTAVQYSKDRLIFLLAEDAPWPHSMIEKGSGAERIEALRAELSQGHLCSFFWTAQELATLVTTAVANWLSLHDRELAGRGTIAPEELDTYFERLQQQYARLDLDALTPPQREEYLRIRLQAVFVEPSVRENPPPLELPKELWRKLQAEGEFHEGDLPTGFDLEDLRRAREVYERRPRRPAIDVLIDPGVQRVVLLGDPGAGKSTLARYLVLSMTTPDGDERLSALRSHLPLLIELRAYAVLQAKGTHRTFLEFLDHLGRTEGLGLNHETLDAYLTHDGRALVIFDGLDEVLDPEERDTIARHIAGFAARYPKSRVLVTSRIIGYRRATLADAGFMHYTLQDLDEGQIGAFLTSWYVLALHDRPKDAEPRRQRLQVAIQESRPIRELAGNPLLLTILAVISKHQELPRERWKVYDHAATVLVEHWDVNRHLREKRILADFLGEDDKKELLRRIAFRMQAGVGGLAGNYLTGDALREEFERYLTLRYQRGPVEAKVIATAMIAQFRERNFILSRYGPEAYGFVHRAFLEYFCAGAYVWQFEKNQELTLEQLKQNVFARHWEDASWREVLRLIAGLVAERFAGELVVFLARDAYRPWPRVFGDRPPRNIALAVQCLTEIRNLRAVGEQASLVLRVLMNLFEYSSGVEDLGRNVLLEREIVPAVEAIGEAWPDRETYLEWYRARWRGVASHPISGYAARIAAALFPRSPDVRSLLLQHLRTTDPGLLRAGIDGLTRMLSANPDLLPVLRDWAVNDAEGRVRQAALQVLTAVRADDPDVLMLLRERAVHDPESRVRQAAMRALTTVRADDPRVQALLQERAANDPDSDVRQAAVQTLIARIDDHDVFALLRERAVKEATGSVRQAAVAALLPRADDPDVSALLRGRVVDDPDGRVRQAAVQALGEVRADDPDVSALLRGRVVDDPDGRVRQAAVQALGEVRADDPDVLALLRERAVDDPDSDVRWAAVQALGEVRADNPDVLALLRERAANDCDPDVRQAAMQTVIAIRPNDPNVWAMLRDQAVDDPDSDVRWAAVQAFRRFRANDPEVWALLRDRAVDDPDSGLRWAAVKAIGRSRAEDPDVLALLRERVVNDANSNVRQAAVQAMIAGWVNDPDVSALLRGWAVGDPDSGLRWAAVKALGEARPDDPDVLALLRGRAIDDPDSRVRQAAVHALGRPRADDPDVMALLRGRVVDDTDSRVRRAAVRALRHWADDPDVLALLRGRAVNDPDSRVQWAAVQTIIAALPADADTLVLARSVEPSGVGFQREKE